SIRWTTPQSVRPAAFCLLIFLARSVFHLKRRALLGPALAAIIQPRRGNVGMPQPFLHFGNVGVMRQGIGGSRCTQSMHTEAMHIGIDPWIGSTNGIFALPSRWHASAAAVRHAAQHGHTQPRYAAQDRGG